MKTNIGRMGILGVMIGLAGTLALPWQTLAQTSASPAAPPVTSGNFFDSVTSYFSTFNPELEGTFTNRGTFWTSVDSIQGGDNPLVNSIGMSYSVFQMVSVEGVFRNSGTAGAVVSGQGGLGFNFVVHDVRLTAYGDGGYAFEENKQPAYAEIGVRVMKALTTHTFAGVGIAAQMPANRQILSAFVGFTF